MVPRKKKERKQAKVIKWVQVNNFNLICLGLWFVVPSLGLKLNLLHLFKYFMHRNKVTLTDKDWL